MTLYIHKCEWITIDVLENMNPNITTQDILVTEHPNTKMQMGCLVVVDLKGLESQGN